MLINWLAVYVSYFLVSVIGRRLELGIRVLYVTLSTGTEVITQLRYFFNYNIFLYVLPYSTDDEISISKHPSLNIWK